jgi:ribosome-associated translation inhibitor RaiA
VQVIISARGMTVSRSYKDELTRKLAKLEPMLLAPVATRAILTREKHRRTAALTLVARSRAFRSRETATSLAVAVDRAVLVLRRQVRETTKRRPRRPTRP